MSVEFGCERTFCLVIAKLSVVERGWSSPLRAGVQTGVLSPSSSLMSSLLFQAREGMGHIPWAAVEVSGHRLDDLRQAGWGVA